MQMQSLPQLLEPSLGKVTHPHNLAARVGKPCLHAITQLGKDPEEGSSPGWAWAPGPPLAVESSRKDLQRLMVFSLQCPSGKLHPLQFQSLVKCWNVSGAHIIVHRMDEGGNEPSQGEGDIRDVERLNDPAHSTL